jgi:hypothetical protein
LLIEDVTAMPVADVFRTRIATVSGLMMLALLVYAAWERLRR